jgi:hypothetical protein
MDQASTKYGVITVVFGLGTISAHYTQYIMIVSCAGPPLAVYLISRATFTFTFSSFVTLRRDRDFPTWLTYREMAVQPYLLSFFYLTQLNASLHFSYLTDQHGVGTFYRL